MKYTCEVVVDKPRDEVIKVFDNPDNMKYWQKGFESFEHVSGEPGKPGAESIIKYDFGNRKMELIETITFRQLPDEFHGNYTTKGVVNIQKNYFKEEGGKTKWISEAEFKFSGFMKIMAFFMGKKPFKKQTQAFMEDFKAFAEGNPKYGN
ncbi:SRPBCC family protein [Ekhidna sp.]|jgi:carbon monoxide dehydrogenase subunit G|uniref:SRPBCC family protein n=1 Tax=Ekhidna sp. TaxID=2608089 RepID=UPI0032EA9AFA